MKFIKYGKYVGEPADAIDLEELVKEREMLVRKLGGWLFKESLNAFCQFHRGMVSQFFR